MGLFTWIAGKVLGKVAGGVLDKAGGAVASIVDKGASIATAAMSGNEDSASARTFAAPNAGTGWFRSFADGVNCLVRPTVATYLALSVSGIVEADLSQIDPDIKDYFLYVMTFYFGQRAVIHDVPRLLAGLRKALK